MYKPLNALITFKTFCRRKIDPFCLEKSVMCVTTGFCANVCSICEMLHKNKATNEKSHPRLPNQDVI